MLLGHFIPRGWKPLAIVGSPVGASKGVSGWWETNRLSSPDGLFIRARLKCLHQVAHLAHVVVQMSRTDQEEPEACLDGGLIVNRREKRRFILRCERLHDQLDGLVKPRENLVAGIASGVGELVLALPGVARAGDERTDIVVQVAGQMKNQMADRVAERERLDPELLIRNAPGGLLMRPARCRK